MSKSNLGHELTLENQEEDVLTKRCAEIIPNRESVLPFAKDMVDNVVTGALSILDVSRKEGKPWREVLAAEKSSSGTMSGRNVEDIDGDATDLSSDMNQTAEGQRATVQVMHLQVREDVVCDSFHAEQVANIVKGLQDIQIGDSAYVLPIDRSNIEKQVKRAVRNINSLEFGDLETARLIICDGQGDVDAAILEAELGPPGNANHKPQNDNLKISKRFLHKMIEELEDGADSTSENIPDHGNKEGTARWEESEEQFIRLIEGPEDERVSGLLENRENRQQSEALAEDMYERNRNLLHSLGHGERTIITEAIIGSDRNNYNQPRDFLDNYTDEEPYWCTAGLITRSVTPPARDQVISNNDQYETSNNQRVDVEVKRTETSVCDSLLIAKKHAEELNHETPDKDKDKDKVESKVKGKKKNSIGKRLRKFFSRIKIKAK